MTKGKTGVEHWFGYDWNVEVIDPLGNPEYVCYNDLLHITTIGDSFTDMYENLADIVSDIEEHYGSLGERLKQITGESDD